MSGLLDYPMDGLPLSKMSSSLASNIETRNVKPKIGILGLGSIGSRHLKNFKELGCEVSVYDPNEKCIYTYTREELINWADAIVVATPSDHHFHDIMTCGKPVFVEKPIVNDRPQLDNLETDHVLMVGYNLRFHTCVIKARQWLKNGLIGKPIWARFTCAQYNDKPAYLRDGVILNWSHELDLALHLLGNPTVMGCMQTRNGNAEYIADILLLHNNTMCQTVVHLDYLTKWERRGFLIVGTDGSIEVDLLNRQAFLRDNKGSFPEIHYGRGSFDGDYLAEARAFLKRLDGEETLGCTAEEAMQVVRIALAAKDMSYD